MTGILLQKRIHCLKRVRGDGEGLDELLSWFDGLPQDEADKVVRYWCRPAEYLHAVWLHRQRERVGVHPG